MKDPELMLEYYLEIAKGNIEKNSPVHVRGRNTAVSTAMVPLAFGGVWQTPQVAGATALRVKAGNAADTAAGAGAREITLTGISPTGEQFTTTLATAGASPSANTTETFIRLLDYHVSASGTYATAAAVGGSHTADIVIETPGGTAWGTIDSTKYAKGESEIGLRTVPLGKTGFIPHFDVFVDGNKTADIFFFERRNILETAVPYSASRGFSQGGIVGPYGHGDVGAPLGPFPALTDLGFMATVPATTTEAGVNFEILLIDD